MKWILIFIMCIPLILIAEEEKKDSKSAEQKSSESSKKNTSKNSNANNKGDCKGSFYIPSAGPAYSVGQNPNNNPAVLKSGIISVLKDFNKKLTIPSLATISQDTKIKQVELAKELGSRVGSDFWDYIQKTNPEYIKRIRLKVARAYIKSITDNQPSWKNKPPSMKRLFDVYINYDSYTKTRTGTPVAFKNFKAILNEGKSNGLPVFFPGGIQEVESFAKKISPTAFRNFMDTNLYGHNSSLKAAQAIKKANGFIVTSVTAQIPVDKNFFDNMLFYAKEKGFPIIVMPSSGLTEGIDPYILQYDNVHIITHDIEISKYLRLWSIPILPKNQNPDASLDQPRQGKRGQVQIVSAPQLRYKVIPTADNKDHTHAVWSTGSISENLYPYDNPASGRQSNLAKARHSNSFLVAERTDKSSGVLKKGTPGMYHIRPVSNYDHTEYGSKNGFIDLGYFYYDGKKQKVDGHTIVIGDIHDHNTNQNFLRVVKGAISKLNIKNVVFHDILDGQSHNHHEAKQLMSKLEKYKKGELNIQKEVEGVIQTINAFLHKFPQLTVIINDSNHHYWLEKLMDDPNAITDMENREFIVELISAMTEKRGQNIYEYLLNSYREQYHKNLIPFELRDKKQKESIYISHPERVKVMKKGEPFIVGPDHNPVHVHFHGHKGANGARGSIISHARAAENNVIGDSHSPAIHAGAVNVGVATHKEVNYTKGGYSSWQNAFAIINEETGTAQLVVYEPKTGLSWYQNPKKGFLPQTEEEPISVPKNDNDLAGEGVKIPDQFNKRQFKGVNNDST